VGSLKVQSCCIDGEVVVCDEAGGLLGTSTWSMCRIAAHHGAGHMAKNVIISKRCGGSPPGLLQFLSKLAHRNPLTMSTGFSTREGPPPDATGAAGGRDRRPRGWYRCMPEIERPRTALQAL
jgi:hypothetical protein